MGAVFEGSLECADELGREEDMWEDPPVGPVAEVLDKCPEADALNEEAI
jgi:hypothetical protein